MNLGNLQTPSESKGRRPLNHPCVWVSRWWPRAVGFIFLVALRSPPVLPGFRPVLLLPCSRLLWTWPERLPPPASRSRSQIHTHGCLWLCGSSALSHCPRGTRSASCERHTPPLSSASSCTRLTHTHHVDCSSWSVWTPPLSPSLSLFLPLSVLQTYSFLEELTQGSALPQKALLFSTLLPVSRPDLTCPAFRACTQFALTLGPLTLLSWILFHKRFQRSPLLKSEPSPQYYQRAAPFPYSSFSSCTPLFSFLYSL